VLAAKTDFHPSSIPPVSATLLRTMHSRSFLTLFAVLLASTLANQSNQGTAVSATAKGSFDVKATRQPAAEGDDPGISRMAFDKQFHGNLEGTSKVQMLAASTSVKLSGAYVALEKVYATLAGHKGSFILQRNPL
jgi:uncharacterized protein DUF3224